MEVSGLIIARTHATGRSFLIAAERFCRRRFNAREATINALRTDQDLAALAASVISVTHVISDISVSVHVFPYKTNNNGM